MATTFVPTHPLLQALPVKGAVAFSVGTVTPDTSYTTGGLVVTAATFGLDKLYDVIVTSQTAVITKHVRFVPSTLAFLIVIEDAISGIEAQAGNGTDQSGATFEVLAIGEKRA